MNACMHKQFIRPNNLKTQPTKTIADLDYQCYTFFNKINQDIRKGVIMKIISILIFFFLFMTCMIIVSKASAQSTQCVVDQIQGSLVTVTCPGQGTRVENIGGTADRYKAGDTITVPNQSRNQGAVDQRTPVDQRSGRR